MRHVRDKFLSGIVQGFNPGQHPVKSVGNQLCLKIVRHRYAFIQIAVRQFFYGTGNLLERLHQNSGQYVPAYQNQYNNNAQYHNALLLQNFLAGIDLQRGGADEHDSHDFLVHRFRIGNFNGHLNILISVVVTAGLRPVEAVDNLL